MLKSDSESFKAIFALVKLFMSKSAHNSVSSKKPAHGSSESRKYENYQIVQAFIERLKNYADHKIEPNEVGSNAQRRNS